MAAYRKIYSISMIIFSLERKYAYNELGQISWINYYGYLPCTIGEVHYTYANGHKTEIKVDASAPAWKLVAENDMGLPVSIETGPLTGLLNTTGTDFR